MKISRFLNLGRLLKKRTASTSGSPSMPSTRPAYRPRSMPAQIPSSMATRQPTQLKQMHDKGIFFDFTPSSYGDFFTKIFDGTIAMSLKLRPERRGSDERTRQRYNDLAQQLLKGAEFPDASDESRDRVYDSLVQRVMKSGVKFAAGSDMGWFYPGKTRGEASISRFPTLHKAGMPSLDVIRAITTNAAEMLGWQDRIGAVEPGKFADIVAVAGAPVADITELERVRFVMKNGEVVRKDLTSPKD